MNDERAQFMNAARLPARMTAQEVGWFLGFSANDVPVLARYGLIKPLGHPATNGIKYYATVAIQERYGDVRWLTKASDTIIRYWQSKNERKTVNQPSAEAETH